MNKTHDISQSFPQWQFSLRKAAENLNTPSYARTEAELEAMNLRGRARSQGRTLHFLLTHVFGIPIAEPTLDHNYYTVDGYWFSLKHDSVPGEDDKQPVYVSSSTGKKSEAIISFTLYAGKVVSDPAFPDWPKRQVLVGRDVHLMYTNYNRLRAALAEALDDLATAYQNAIPNYLAWKDLQGLPSDAAMRQDYFLQLIRRALREMPAAELLTAFAPPEPVEVLQAVLAESQACMDGLLLAGVERSEEVALTLLQSEADAISATLHEMGNYDPFDDDDEPDNLDDDGPDDDDFDDDDEPDDDETESPDLEEATDPENLTEALPA